MIVSIPCSKKVFNIWCSVLIIICFFNKFPGPLLGVIFLVFFILIKLVEHLKFEKKVQQTIKTGILPVETVGAISLALNEKIKQMDSASFKSLKIQYNLFKEIFKNAYPSIFQNNNCNETFIEEVKPTLNYIENQIAFIKKEITDSNKDMLEKQLNAYFILLVFCYSKFYKDVDVLSKELLKLLNS